MSLITHSLAAGLLVWLSLIALIIMSRMWDGGINTTGFLRTRKAVRGNSPIEPERMVFSLLFPIVIIGYIVTALQADVTATHRLPDVPESLITLLTGGNGLYLAGKIARINYRRTP